MSKIRLKLAKTPTCDQCSASIINGFFCHETDCPQENKKWAVDRWIETDKCSICGYEVLAGEICCEAEWI